jgi:hypothetical protein
MSELQLALDFTELPLRDHPVEDKTICLSVKLRKPGIQRRVSPEAVEVTTDKTMLHIAKDLLDSPQLREIDKLDGRIRATVKKFALAYPLARGFYLLPLELVEQIDPLLEEFLGERTLRVEQFLDVYPAQVGEAMERLQDLFCETDYPTPEVLRESFGMEIRYINFGLPGTLRQISDQLFQREQDKFAKQFEELLVEVKQGLRGELKSLVDHLVEKLTPGPEGRPKRFERSTVDNLKFFLDVFNAKNIADDLELQAIVQDLRELLGGVQPEELRQNQGLRAQVLTGLADRIQPLLDQTVQETPDRLYVLE